MKNSLLKKNTLVINLSSSYCGECGMDCDPNEKSHMTNLGYDEETRKRKGCGAVYKYVTSDYCSRVFREGDASAEAATKRLRPDLKFYII